MSKEIWNELFKYDIFPDKESIPDNVRFKHTKNYFDFNHNICFSLAFYQDAIDYERGSKKKEHLKYAAQRENSILRLITGLEVYLVDTFKMISKSLPSKLIDRDILDDFVKEFSSKKSFEEFKKSSEVIPLEEIIPEKINLQQKDKCRKAYSLIGIDVLSVGGDNHVIWGKIFTEKDSYMKMRHEIVHRGVTQTSSIKINAVYMRATALDIAKFVYNLDSKIIDMYPKSTFPHFYLEEGSPLGIIL